MLALAATAVSFVRPLSAVRPCCMQDAVRETLRQHCRAAAPGRHEHAFWRPFQLALARLLSNRASFTLAPTPTRHRRTVAGVRVTDRPEASSREGLRRGRSGPLLAAHAQTSESLTQHRFTVMPMMEAIRYTRGQLHLLDQRRLPFEEQYLPVASCEAAHGLIRDMAVRGAPAIAVAGVLALAVELHAGGGGAQFASADEAARHVQARMDYLVTRCSPLPPSRDPLIHYCSLTTLRAAPFSCEPLGPEARGAASAHACRPLAPLSVKSAELSTCHFGIDPLASVAAASTLSARGVHPSLVVPRRSHELAQAGSASVASRQLLVHV